MTDVGAFRHIIIFKQFDGTEDAYGEPLDMDPAHWTQFHKSRASIDPVSGKEFWANSQSVSEVTHKIRCRWFPGLKTAMRIYFGSRVFSIVSAINWQEADESFLIMAKELIE